MQVQQCRRRRQWRWRHDLLPKTTVVISQTSRAQVSNNAGSAVSGEASVEVEARLPYQKVTV